METAEFEGSPVDCCRIFHGVHYLLHAMKDSATATGLPSNPAVSV